MISIFNETIAYVCAMTAAFLRLPPFSLPPISVGLAIPKLILKLTKLLFVGSNIFINLLRRNWGIVIRSGLASFSQFMITQNGIGTQLILGNQTLKLINKNLKLVPTNILKDLNLIDLLKSKTSSIRTNEIMNKLQEKINYKKK